jgi:hypothetical protein
MSHHQKSYFTLIIHFLMTHAHIRAIGVQLIINIVFKIFLVFVALNCPPLYSSIAPYTSFYYWFPPTHSITDLFATSWRSVSTLAARSRSNGARLSWRLQCDSFNTSSPSTKLIYTQKMHLKYSSLY